MPVTPKKVHRRRRGELTIEQTQDPALITTILRNAVMTVPEVERSDECFLVAYWGDEPVGIAGLETNVDSALMGPFFVLDSMRRHGVGARLVTALRLAALSRGARRLYAAVPTRSVDYFARFGFAEVNPAELIEACPDGLVVRQSLFDKTPQCRAVRVDLSWESVVER